MLLYYFLPAKAKFTFLPPALFVDVSNVANCFVVVEVVGNIFLFRVGAVWLLVLNLFHYRGRNPFAIISLSSKNLKSTARLSLPLGVNVIPLLF